jgi:hypothetical protein
LLARPPQGGTATTLFSALPAGNLTVQASAYPATDGTGIAQATATAPIVIQAGQTTSFQLVLVSTIDRIQVTPSTLTLNPGQTLPVAVTATNTLGEVVLTNASTMSWVSQNPAIATVQSSTTDSLVTFVSSGNTTINVTENESGKSASVAVTTATTGVSDDFNDNQTNANLWQVSSAGVGPTVAEVNQRLEITIPANSSNSQLFGGGYRTKCALRGDFDVQVDYELLTWPNSNGIRLGFWLGDVSNVPHVASTHRVSRVVGDDSYAGVHSFDTVVNRIATTATSGTLRLVRTSGVFSCYYRNTQTTPWTLILSGGNNTSDHPINLFAWSKDTDFNHAFVKVAFDNFVVNKGEFVCP